MISDVISWKFNNQPGMSTADGKIIEFPGGIPTQAVQDLWTAEYKAYKAKNAYKELRKYPSIEDQLDMLYHDKIDGTTIWQDAITAVKLAHPK